MATNTGIEWTDATWNPVTGCTKISAGCDNCYAHTLAHRLLAKHYGRRKPVIDSPENRLDPFAVRLWPERLAEPSRWTAARMVFVNSMSDLFHTDVPDAYLRRTFAIMLREHRHIYQVLTKRPGRVLRFWNRHQNLFDGQDIPPHIWIGTSVENQAQTYRLSHLRRIPAAIRFLSCEPLLGPLSLCLDDIHWVIAGGESGVVHRPMDVAWAVGIRDQCLAAKVPFFFKQVGGRTPKANGRKLEGRTWSEYPYITGHC